jgi:ribonuclease D
VIAIDTEFMRTNTYFATPGLIQIAAAEQVFLIDPLDIEDLSLLAPVLESKSIVKVLHSMSEDIELLFHSCKARIESPFDTQVAAAFLGLGPSLGYQKLVQEVLGHELDKSETRSDWLKRPLSESQLGYAAKDVEYLLVLYRELETRLKEKAYLSAVLEESRALVQQFFQSWDEPENAYLKLRGGCELKKVDQALLQSLVMWRDALAQSKNIPKPWVFSDNSLISIAEKRPKNLSDLKRVKDAQHKSIRRYGESVLDVVSGFEIKTDHLRLIDKPVRGRELDYYQKIKAIVAQAAKDSGIAVQLLGSRKMLERVVINVRRHGDKTLPKDYQGWRRQWVSEKMEKALEI